MLESDGPGGAERMLIELAEELRRRDYDVCPVGPANGCGWLAEQFRERDFDPEVFYLRRALDLDCARGLVQLFRRRRVDIVHSHEFTMALYGAAAARWAGLPHVITMHGGTGFAQRWRRRIATRWAIRQSQSVVAVSRATRTTLASALAVSESAFTVIPNGVAPVSGTGSAVRAELGLDPDELLILAVGNLYPVKGHAVLLRALAAIGGGEGARWRLAIAGRGEEEERLRMAAVELGVSDRFQLLGYRSDIANLLTAADMYAMPSLSEGLPLALIEAMFAGKPIIASDVGGIPEVVEGGHEALLVPPGDAHALTHALVRLLSDPGLRRQLAAAAQRRAQADFAVGAMATAYERLYRLSPLGDEQTRTSGAGLLHRKARSRHSGGSGTRTSWLSR
jgi:glycosyltransferase involved in cell wall biosynthesis